MPPRLLFLTGKLAEPALRRLLGELAPRAGFQFEIGVLPITVVALATIEWITRHWPQVGPFDKVVLPGLCSGDEAVLAERLGRPIERGPKDLRDLPDFFGHGQGRPAGYGRYDIEILAEINHVPRLTRAEIVAQALRYRQAGADIIDLGCEPGVVWADAADTIKALRDQGLRVSIDSLNVAEIATACRAGAELVLSVNHSNRDAARDWGCEVVVIPDFADSEAGATSGWLHALTETVEVLDGAKVKYRLDPVIEPIGYGFAASLGRYLDTRRHFPHAEILMGIGNLTELTEVDSAGVNVTLLGFCQEVGIRSVLTTEVINWSRSSVRELDVARRLVYHAVSERVLPKHVEAGLVMLRDPKLRVHGAETLRELAGQISDRNFRLFAERGQLHAVNDKMSLAGSDPFELFAEMSRREPIDAAHAFYLGFELAKAATALALGKNYVQDQALNWGLLTVPEDRHRSRMKDDER